MLYEKYKSECQCNVLQWDEMQTCNAQIRKTKRETNEVCHPMDANIIVRPETNGSKNTPTSEIFKRDDISPQKMLQW